VPFHFGVINGSWTGNPIIIIIIIIIITTQAQTGWGKIIIKKIATKCIETEDSHLNKMKHTISKVPFI